MVYRNCGKIDAKVSILGFGMMRLPTNGLKIDLDETRRIVRYALDNGVNYIDTAYMYHFGHSEEAVKYALEGVDRKSYYLADKMPGFFVKTPADAEKIFQNQLDKCGVDYFDFYLCHNLTAANFKIYEKFLLDFLLNKKKEGRIKRLGFSFHGDMDALKHIVGYHDWDFAQIQYNYYDYKKYSKEEYDYLTERKIPLIVMEPVRGGMLANLNPAARKVLKAVESESSLASWAIRFAMNPENILTVLSGMSNFEQVEDNIKTAKNFTPLSENQLNAVNAAYNALKKSAAIPCTGCRYCMDCAFGVDIPENFALYNDYLFEKDKEKFVKSKVALGKRGATSCKKCGACLPKCPQNIDIIGKLKKIGGIK